MAFFEYYLQMIIFTAALPLGLGLAVYFLNRTFCSLVGTGRGRPLLFFLHVIITPLREFAHLAAAVLTLHHVSDFCLLNPYDPEGELGFVEHDYNRKNPVAVFGNYLFAVLPAALFLFLSMIVIFVCFRGAFGDLSASVADLVAAEAGLGEYAKLALGFFPAMIRDATSSVFAKVMGCLILLFLCLGAYVSPGELMDGFGGLMIYGSVTLVFAAVTALFDGRARRLILTAFRTFATGVTALFVVILIFSVAALAVGALVFLIRSFAGEGKSALPIAVEESEDEDDYDDYRGR